MAIQTDKQRQQAVDALSPGAIFTITLAGHIALAFLAEAWVFSPGEIQPFWPAAGVSTGIALASDRWPHRIAALSGGLIAQLIYSALMFSAALPVLTYTVGVGVEISLSTASILVLFTAPRLSGSHGPIKSVVSLFICLGASALGSLVAFIGHPDAPDRVQWILAHGTGMFACGSALLIGRTGWLTTANPSNRSRELVVSLIATALLTTIAFSTPGALHYVVLGSVLLITTRFGVRIGHPVALVLICAAALQISTGTGTFVSDKIFDVRSFQTFAAITLASTGVVGRLTMALDKELRRRTRTVRRWQKLAATGSDAYIEIGSAGQIVDVSEGLPHILGIHADVMPGMHVRELFDMQGWIKVEHFARLVRSGRSVRFDRSYRTADGTTRWALSNVEPRLDKDGNFAGCTIYLFDTTDAHQINAERVETHVAIAAAQESERRNLAQRVHDGALQDFAAANLLVGAATLDSAPDLTEAYLARIESLLGSGMRKLRTDAIGNDEIDLREVVVVEALENVVKKFAIVKSAEVRIRERRLNDATPKLSGIIFQIAQEALVNALVHSHAKHISVSITGDNAGFTIRVIDDGIGFDSRRVSEVGHLGLNNMNALAYQVDGWCSVSTRNDGGTRVEAWVPCQRTGGDTVQLGIRSNLQRGPQSPVRRKVEELQVQLSSLSQQPPIDLTIPSSSEGHESEHEWRER